MILTPYVFSKTVYCTDICQKVRASGSEVGSAKIIYNAEIIRRILSAEAYVHKQT
jgi:hypothetical protein